MGALHRTSVTDTHRLIDASAYVGVDVNSLQKENLHVKNVIIKVIIAINDFVSIWLLKY